MVGRPVQAVRGPLEPFADGFAEELAGRGYSPSAVRLRLWLLDDLSRWIDRREFEFAELTVQRVEEFVVDRRARGYKSWVSPRSMDLPMGYLRAVGVAPVPAVPVTADPAGVLLEAYHRYLVEERGLAASTINFYENLARLFLSARSGDGELRLDSLCAGDVTRFVGDECGRRSIAAAKFLVAALRSFLRYLHVAGVIPVSLTSAVPGVANRRGLSLPRGLVPAEVGRLLASCDRRRKVGRRDYAALMVLARLGLRAAEVAHLELGDVDWRHGEILIRGKGNRQELLPLPCDVGEALVAYLSDGRPEDPRAGRGLFLRVVAPVGRLQPRGVSAIVHDACVRAGLPPVGAHRLRHGAATEMLRAGASLPEIAQVLRHHQLDTTAIYAKVDHVALRELAMPWPGGAA